MTGSEIFLSVRTVFFQISKHRAQLLQNDRYFCLFLARLLGIGYPNVLIRRWDQWFRDIHTHFCAYSGLTVCVPKTEVPSVYMKMM